MKRIAAGLAIIVATALPSALTAQETEGRR